MLHVPLQERLQISSIRRSNFRSLDLRGAGGSSPDPYLGVWRCEKIVAASPDPSLGIPWLHSPLQAWKQGLVRTDIRITMSTAPLNALPLFHIVFTALF